MQSAVKHGTIYEFADFRLVPGEELLLRDGELVSLPRKAFRVLTLLVERHGHLVPKSEILDLVWEESFVEEGSLPKAVSSIRQSLGDASKERFIQTIPGRGYRFVAPVSVVTDLSGAFRLSDLSRIEAADNGVIAEEEVASANGNPEIGSVDVLGVEKPEEKTDIRAGLSRGTIIAACVIGAIVIAVVIGYYGFVPKGSARPIPSIAVMPITPLNSERNDLYDVGIAEAIINRLASSEGLKVRRVSAVRDYTGQKIDPMAVGREQKVDHVLESNYQISGGRIKVTAELYNIASGKVEDTFQTEQSLENIFGAQDAIAAYFGSQLTARFGVQPGAARNKRGTNNEEAYRLYQQARYLMDKRNRENSKKAVEYLRQAVALDPNYAQAWAAQALAVKSAGAIEGNDTEQKHRISVDAIQKALAIDPELPDAHTALCIDKLLYEYDFAGAETACKEAIRLDPNFSAAHNAYAWVLNFQGRSPEALTEINTAIDIEPASYVNKRFYGDVLYIARSWDKAEAYYRRMIEIEPSDVPLYNQLIRTLEAQGKEAEAFETFVSLLKVLKRDDPTIARYQSVYQTSGWRGVLLERAKDPNPGFPNGNYFPIACLYAGAGDKDKAFEFLEAALKEREWAMPMLQVYPQLDSIRDDPRYADLVQRVNGK